MKDGSPVDFCSWFDIVSCVILGKTVVNIYKHDKVFLSVFLFNCD